MSYVDLARANLPSIKSYFVGGADLAVGNAAYTLLGPSMGTVGTTFVLPAAAGSLTAVSASASDTGALYVEYIDANWYERSALVSMTGITPAVLAASARRVNRAIYLNGSNVGEISLKVGAVKVNAIRAGAGVSRAAIYTAPRGQRVWIIQVTANCETTKTADMRLCSNARDRTGNYTQAEAYSVSTFSPTEIVYPVKIVDLSGSYGVTVWLDAKLVTTGSGIVSGMFQILAQRLTDMDAPGFGLG
jgi:hypothetical protein